jgi:nitrite reductase/ring-hydroxylating ferredoxin subunit
MSSSSEGVKGTSRRDFIAAAVGTLFACPLLKACEYVELRDSSSGEGSGEQGFTFSINDPDFAALATVGGNVCVAFGPVEVVVYRASEDEILAFEKLCPHASLPIAECGEGQRGVTYDVQSREITCIFHSSVFNADNGAVVSGPAPRSLFVFPVTFDPASGAGSISTGSF